jgi:autotransporter-associated beta strand protein
LDNSNPLGNGSTIEKGTIVINAGGVFQITAVNGNATVPAIVLNGGTMQAVGSTGGSSQYAALELGSGLTAGGVNASPSLITVVNGGPFAEINLLVNASSGSSLWTVNPAGINPTGAPDLTVSIPLINSSSTQYTNTGLSKSGAGTLLLNATGNNYTGPTTINAGTLILGDPGLLAVGTYAAPIINNSLFVCSTTAGQIFSGVISGTGTNAVYGPGANLTLTGASTYTGPTIIGAGGSLLLSGTASIATSSSITVSNGGTFNVSGESSQYKLGSAQSLLGTGNINGTIGSSSGSKIFPGTDGTAGTLTFGNGLNVAVGASLNLDVGTTYNGANDLIIVGGALTIGSGDFVHIKAPSTSSSLDESGHDYILVTAGSISGSFSQAPAFDVLPTDAGHYSIVTDPINNQVRLHYSSTLSPVITTVTATPSSGIVRGSTVFVSATVAPGAGSVTNVSVSLGAVGGGTLALLPSGTPNVYTNSIVIVPTIAPGPYNLTVFATDTTPLSGAGNLAFTVAASSETWDGLGANQSVDTNANWTSGFAPGYVGDSLVFAGTVGLNPVLDQDYTVTALTFSNTAGLFIVTNSTGDFLTLAPGAGLTNNSANTEIVSVPIELAGSVILKSATATGALALTQPVGELVVGSGSVTNAGGTNILYGANTYTGNTTITAGTLIIGSNAVSAGSLNGGGYTGAISNSGTFDYFGGQAANFSGPISGAGGFNLGNGGTNNGPIVFMSNNFSFTGNMVITNTYVSLVQANNNNPITTSVLGNPATAGRTVTISNAFLSFDATGGNELGGGAFAPALGFIVGQGGVMQITSGNCVIGPLTLNGGIVNIASTAGTQYEPFELGGAVTVGGTTASLITNVTDGPGAGLNLTIAATSGNTTFTVAATGATGPDLTVAVPLANSGSEAAGASTIGLIKAGAGTMALTDPNNSYTGGTTINAGTLILANSGELNGGTYTGTISNSGTFIVSTAAGQTLSGPVYGAGLLEVSGAGVSLTLGAANAYTGKTLITNSATLFLGSSGSIANSSNITVAPNSLFDVSQAVSPALGVNQSLFGLGTIHTANSVGLGSSTGSVIAPSNDGTNAIGRMSFTGGGLSFGAGATAKFALSATYNGVNDSIAVAGALTGAANSIHLRAPSAAANLDTSGNDYILMTAGSVVGGFASTPIWDVAPLNAANYTIISDPVNANVRLHYSVNLPPTAGGSFNPSTNALRNGNALLTVLVTNGSSGTISSVVVNAAPLGGSSSLALAFQSPGVYTTTITIPPTAAPGAQSVLVQITDGNGLVDAISVGLTIVTSREIWDGLGAGNQNWDVNANWASGAAPGYLGDSLIFAGNVETSPIMDQNYTTGSLTFSNTTSSFNITSTGSTLTLPNAAGITNLSGVAQTLNVPIALNGALILNSTNTNGSLVLPGNLSEVTLGAGSITNTGSGTNILEGNNSFTGNITIAGGTFELGTNGNLAGGTYNGTISLSTGAKFNYFAGTPQTFSGTSVITGPTGAPLNFIGGGTNTGSPIVILAGRNTFSGNTYISNIWVSNQRSDSASQDPPFSGIGNVDQAGQTFTIDHSALLSFDIGNELGENNSPDNVTFVITNGGTFAQTVGNSPIGSLALYGGTVDIQSGGGPGSSAAGVELSGTVVAGNATTGPSYIGSSTGAGGMNLGVITSAGYQASFTVNPAGVNPSGLPDLTVSAFLGNCGNNNAASGLIKLGTGSLLLSGENVYTSTTTLSNGIITLGSAETAPTSGPLGASPSTTPGRISFGGGTLQYSSANQFDYSGGFSTAAGQTIIIDTAGQTIQFATPLISSGGTLTVTDSVGSGVLSLTAAETYSGATTVNGGTLSLGTGGSLASASSLNIGAGGTFDVSQVSPYSLGTSASLTASGTGAKPATLNGSANLGSRPITLNYNGLNPALTVTGGTLTLNGNAFTVNGTPLAPATYTLIQQASGSVSSSGTYTVSGTAIASPNTGSITVTGGQVKLTVSPPAFPTTGTNLTFSVSGRSLTFTWPASYLGSVLQSNSVNIASNSLWFAISGSASVTNLTLPVATNGTVFYRLNTP